MSFASVDTTFQPGRQVAGGWRRCRAALAGLVLAAAVPVTSADVPPIVREHGYTLQQVGRGDLSWLGFGIYEASLWTPDGTFEAFGQEPVALALWYERRFSVAELLKITGGEWDRLGLGTPAQRAGWRDRLRAMWLDVRKGDNMTAIVLPGRETLFYNGERLLGRIDDPAFGPAYLGIWLDTRSAVSDLRLALLGPPGRRPAGQGGQ